MAIRPVYSKLVLPSRKSLEIIINMKKKKKNGGCPLIRACSLIRSNTVYISSAVPPCRASRWRLSTCARPASASRSSSSRPVAPSTGWWRWSAAAFRCSSRSTIRSLSTRRRCKASSCSTAVRKARMCSEPFPVRIPRRDPFREIERDVLNQISGSRMKGM